MVGEDGLTAIIMLSLQVALVAMVIVLPLATGIGYALSKPGWRGRFLVSALVHMPLVTPPVVTGYVLLLAFGSQGVIGKPLSAMGLEFAFSWAGAALAAAVMALPLVVRPIRLAFEAQDSRLQDMAAILGAGHWKRFAGVALPLALPGLLAGFVLGFARALGEFGATITFVSNIPGETQTLSLAIYSLLQSPTGESAALMLVGVSIAISFAAVLVSEYVAQIMERRAER
ncbi:MAG: molybdate ABC transporter permease subunit [Pseudomonadota bacterium]